MFLNCHWGCRQSRFILGMLRHVKEGHTIKYLQIECHSYTITIRFFYRKQSVVKQFLVWIQVLRNNAGTAVWANKLSQKLASFNFLWTTVFHSTYYTSLLPHKQKLAISNFLWTTVFHMTMANGWDTISGPLNESAVLHDYMQMDHLSSR